MDVTVSNWKVLSGKGWPQLQEATWLALQALEEIGKTDPRAQETLASIRQILMEGAFDAATEPTREPPEDLRRMSESDLSAQ